MNYVISCLNRRKEHQTTVCCGKNVKTLRNMEYFVCLERWTKITQTLYFSIANLRPGQRSPGTGRIYDWLKIRAFRCSVHRGIILTVRKFRRLVVQSSLCTGQKY